MYCLRLASMTTTNLFLIHYSSPFFQYSHTKNYKLLLVLFKITSCTNHNPLEGNDYNI